MKYFEGVSPDVYKRRGQQHDQAVDPDAAAAGRWQAIFEGADVVGIVEHGFLVAGVLGFGLLQETCRLIFRIVQLGEGVGDLATDNEQFKAFGDFRICIAATCQRAYLGRIIDDEGRIPQIGFCLLYTSRCV